MGEAVDQEKPEPVSVLFLSPKWSDDHYGISVIVRSLIDDLNLVDPDGENIKITCVVAEEDRKIGDRDRVESRELNVKIVGAKLPRRSKKKKRLKLICLDYYTATYYRHVIQNIKVSVIVGHAPYLADGAFTFRQLCREKGYSPKVVLLMHDLPKTKHGYFNKELIKDWLIEADHVISVGHNLFDAVETYIGHMRARKPTHGVYLPTCRVEFFGLERRVTDSVRGHQRIVVLTDERKDQIKGQGLNFPVTVASAAKAAIQILDQCSAVRNIHFSLTVIAASYEEKESYEKEFVRVLHDALPDSEDRKLSCYFLTMDDEDKLITALWKCNLCLFPYVKSSTQFGTEALIPAYANVPMIISKNSGVAGLCRKLKVQESVMDITGDWMKDSEVWADFIYSRILNINASQEDAERLRERLLLDTFIPDSHIYWTNVIVGKFSL